MINILLGLVGVLALLFGWEKRKTGKQKEKIEKSIQTIKGMNYRLKISETTAKTKDEILSSQVENRVEKVENEQKIKEAEATENLDEQTQKQQDITNGITDLFNSRNTTL